MVLDTGPGMTPLEQQRAFELFKQTQRLQGRGRHRPRRGRAPRRCHGRRSAPRIAAWLRVLLPHRVAHARAGAPARSGCPELSRDRHFHRPRLRNPHARGARARVECPGAALRYPRGPGSAPRREAARWTVLCWQPTTRHRRGGRARPRRARRLADRSQPIRRGLGARPGALLRILSRSPDRFAPTTDLRWLSVLVVDDHPLARRVLHDHLSALGCGVTTAEDGESAVEIAEDPEEAFDWVLLDRRMPGLDGLATAALLRRASRNRRARLALLVRSPATTRVIPVVRSGPRPSRAVRSAARSAPVTLRRLPPDASNARPIRAKTTEQLEHYFATRPSRRTFE